jgi:hypothetical protein
MKLISIKEKLINEFLSDYKEYCTRYNKQKAFAFASSCKCGALLSNKELKQIKKELGV